MRARKNRPTYYTIFGLRDGTALYGIETSKPGPSRKGGRPPALDPDGIVRFNEERAHSFKDHADKAVIVSQVAIAGRLNTRKAIRELLHPQLDRIEKQLAGLKEQLDRIEAKQTKR